MTSPRRYPLVVGEAATDYSRMHIFPEGERVHLVSASMLPGGQYLWRVKRGDDEADVLEGFLQASPLS